MAPALGPCDWIIDDFPPAGVRPFKAVLVGLDSNVVDLIKEAWLLPEHVCAAEAMESPPRFSDMPPRQEAEVFACYWLLAMAPAWRSTVYTFSDSLYEEVSRAARARSLLRIALDVLVREEQEPEYRCPDPARRPATTDLTGLGVRASDAIHVADVISLKCDYFVTNDRQLRNRSVDLEPRWRLRVRRPSELLVEAVRAGAPWTTRAPWPWESIERIHAGLPGRGQRSDSGRGTAGGLRDLA
jgi:hypothetical protein